MQKQAIINSRKCTARRDAFTTNNKVMEYYNREYRHSDRHHARYLNPWLGLDQSIYIAGSPKKKEKKNVINTRPQRMIKYEPYIEPQVNRRNKKIYKYSDNFVPLS